MGRVEDANHHLEQLNRLYLSTIETLAMAIDAKDQITHGHIRRVQQYAIGLARALGIRDEHQIRAIEAAALLHDMGKLAVPEYILNKPGRLTQAEFDKMKLHASVGADILSAIDFPYPVVPIVRHHHENWNGLGYPDGLKGTDIPIGARILAVVDCFDALTSDRPYRPQLTVDDALAILSERRGSMYDPLVVDKFMAVYGELSPGDCDTKPSRQALFEITRSSLGPSDTSTSGSSSQTANVDSNELLALYDMTDALSGTASLGDAGDFIARHLKRVVPFELCVFFLYDKQNDDLVAAHAVGVGDATVRRIRITLGERLCGWVAANRQTIVNSDPALDLTGVEGSLTPRLRATLATPLIAEQALVGVLALYSEVAHVFTDDHRRIVEVLAQQISRFIVRAAEHESNRREVLTDPVTGLPNTEYLRRLLDIDGRFGGDAFYPLTLLLVDVCGMQNMRGTCEGRMCDQLMAHVSVAIRRSLRGADILFRFGEDQFVVLLTRTELCVADQVARRIVEAAACLKLSITADEDISVALRVGGATAPADGRSLPVLIEMARQRLQVWEAEGTRELRRASIH
jgi:diguanylate cyclase (GGDEF)-like protein/putative nucleotidyltransferase with HDIG domain